MIIFDLDGSLADCEHRRHFVVDPRRCGDWIEARHWEPDWKAFYEACDQDTPIEPVIRIFEHVQYSNFGSEIQIWSGRCESVRENTIDWIIKELYWSTIDRKYISQQLKMRPIGDSTPDDLLKERWLDEAIAEGKTIDFAFSGTQSTFDMWHRRGIFVFDVSQGKGDF